MTSEEQRDRPRSPAFRPLQRPSADSGKSSPRRRSERSIKHVAESEPESDGARGENDALLPSDRSDNEEQGDVTKV